MSGVKTGCERETIRAYHAMSFARCYCPMNLVERFVRGSWARWWRERPWWFDEEWRARILPEFNTAGLAAAGGFTCARDSLRDEEAPASLV